MVQPSNGSYSRLSFLQRKHDSANVVGYEYDYWTSGDKTSTQLDTLRIKKGANSGTYKEFDYTYDAKGNITSITDGNYVTTYYYDDLNQLVRVDDPREGTIWTYSYDLGGNILNKSEYVYNLNGPTEDDLYESRNYSYNTSGWGDVLVGITSNIINKTITSDAIGNMLSDGTWTYTWQHGRQLASMTNGSTTVSFGYDASGMRTSKTVGNKTWEYVYNGSTLSYMTDGTNNLFFNYDSAGPLSVIYNGIEYYYVLNAQGDVIAITNSSGTVVVTYAYDPWGDLLYMTGSMKDTLGQINPLTYRGYVYDHETGLYYLQSRYYNPEMCRFINADGLVSTGQGILGYNMFAYCGNNPIVFADSNGTVPYYITQDEITLARDILDGNTNLTVGVLVQRCRDNIVEQGTSIDNDNEQAAYDALKIVGYAFYKGATIVQLPIGENGFSYGIIFLGDEVYSRSDAIQTLQHEYGHILHFALTGPVGYLWTAAIPSVMGFVADVGDPMYYSQPWEYTAEVLGDVNRVFKGNPYPYYEITKESWGSYMAFTVIIGIWFLTQTGKM